ncbi:MAG TPA: acyl-CoA dehydrogenase family protein [Mycobacteriales bacterium]|nr:acyl-CoA dehydrogenase family protein [Mycobacteriales bacterium]
MTAPAAEQAREVQEELRRTVRRLLEERAPESRVRELMGTQPGHDPALWRELADLGLLGLAIPEELGGAGCGFGEVAVVLEEAGRALLCAPLLASAVLATTALLAGGDDAAQRDLLPRIADGSTIATLAVTEADEQPDPAALVRAVRDGDGWRLTGARSYVVDAAAADLILVAASTDDGLTLFAVETADPAVTVRPLPTLDQTRRLGDVTLRSAPARLAGRPGDALGAVRAALAHGAVAVAVESVGAAARALELAVAHAKVRHQFGRPIGSFQAVKHRCADMLLDVESARSAAYRGVEDATAAGPAGSPELRAAAAVAKSWCSEAFVRVAAATIQLHGGVGFTWEHPAHLYYKRAVGNAQLLGSPVFHRARLAEQLGV